MGEELYALWLQLACGISNSVYLRLFTRFSSCKEIYECEDYSFLNGKYSCVRALQRKELDQAYELQKRCRSANIQILTYYDTRFPQMLRLIQAPPAVLYAIGELRDWNQIVGVAVVGTRQMTAYGAKVAEDFAFYLTLCGVTVVSGLAKGIDTCAHRGAIRANGYTIGVLGTPIDEIYPKENARAFHTLYQRGLVISEMYPGCPRSRGDFPNRNRIISGLSKATLVVEAGERSGALITARHAIDQSKPVYAVPGALGDAHAGTNQLIKRGVQAATSAEDILHDLALSHPTQIHPEYILSTPRIYSYGSTVPDPPEPIFVQERNYGIRPEAAPQKPLTVSGRPADPTPAKQATASAAPPREAETALAGRIRAALEQRALTADELAERLDVGVGELLAELTVLEIDGRLQSAAGNRFIWKN